MATEQSTQKPSMHKLGGNKNELATKKRKKDKNFSQSKDIREDRGVRQRTSGHKK